MDALFSVEFWIFMGVLIVVSVIFMLVMDYRNRKAATSYEEKARELPDFDPNDVYVSPKNFCGIAIDVDRREIALLERSDIRRFGVSSIIACELLEDDFQLAYVNRGSQLTGAAVGGVLLGGVGAVIGGLSGSKRSVKRIKTMTLRFVTDDFDKPNHDILLLKEEIGVSELTVRFMKKH